MTVCLFAGNSPSYLDEKVGDSSTLERVVDFVGSLGGKPNVAVLSTDPIPSIPDHWQHVSRPQWTTAAVVDALAGLANGPDDVILFTFVDQPFLNLELTRRLIDRHEKYRADYTFADGYPSGLSPELLRGRSLAYLKELASGLEGPVGRGSLFEVMQKDMNRFDIETELSRTDQRLLRLVLAADTRANLEMCRALAPAAPAGIDDWPHHVSQSRVSHRSLPRYVAIQVVEQEIQKLVYSPYTEMRSDVLEPGAVMETSRFEGLVDEVAGYSPEATIAISLWGEVSLHPEVSKLLDAVQRHPSLQLLVETSGVGWSAVAREALFSRDRVILVVGLDTNDPDVYRQVRGDGFAEAVDFADHAVARLPKNAYVQAVRCDLTEASLEDFYQRWSKKSDNVIIQKYDWFSGVLPDRRVGDLAPLNRFPCWHLQRDITVLVDGTVPLCREDIGGSRKLGNVFEEGFVSAWRNGENEYARQIDDAYPGVCEKCDEYYTFNF